MDMNKVSTKDKVKRSILRFIIKNKVLYKFFRHNDLFNTAISEARLGNIGREDYWKTYIVGVCRLATYKTQRWKDSDKDALISRTGETDLIDSSGNLNDIHANIENNLEISETYKNNRDDVIKFVGYDPFENYPVETDKPLLYAQLVNFLDEECKNDGMKLAAIIQIVKKLNQAEKLNDSMDRYINDINSMDTNQAVINKMADTSSKLMSVANNLAKDNGIRKLIVPIQSDLYLKIHLIAGKS